jgi:streptogrisin D
LTVRAHCIDVCGELFASLLLGGRRGYEEDDGEEGGIRSVEGEETSQEDGGEETGQEDGGEETGQEVGGEETGQEDGGEEVGCQEEAGRQEEAGGKVTRQEVTNPPYTGPAADSR